MCQAPPTPLSDQRIADYALQCELSAGQTYLAEADGRRVVLKRLESDCLLGGELHPLIHDRLSRVRELAHIGVANLLGVEAEGDQAYLVWEHVEGVPLAEHATSLETRQREALARELIAHVETLHALGIVHGQVHAQNAIVTPAGRLKLTHVSPLLYNETQVDVRAVADILREIGFDIADDADRSLRQLAAIVGSKASDDGTASRARTERQTDDAAGPDRRGSLIAAAVIAAVGAAIALGVWRWTSGLPQIEEIVPTPGMAAERGTAS
jgi:hypothetical protein